MNPSQIVRWCAEEVERQGDGPVAVADMYDAWYAWHTVGLRPSELEAKHLIGLHGLTMKSSITPLGWAKVPRFFSDFSRAEDPENIERAIDNLVSAINEGRVSADEAYSEFERIHPFCDGNGRVGAILWNWLNGTLDKPCTPPEYRR